jgi:hypothetical protein
MSSQTLGRGKPDLYARKGGTVGNNPRIAASFVRNSKATPYRGSRNPGDVHMARWPRRSTWRVRRDDSTFGPIR